MSPDQCQPVRKRGREVELPDPRDKIKLLLEGRVPRDGRLRPVFTKQSVIAQEMGLDPSELSKAMAVGRMSSAKVPELLRLFKLDVADWVVPQTDEDRHWMLLAQEPIDAFRARVRLAGGDDYAGVSGVTWNRFITALRAAQRCTPGNPNSFRIVARDRKEWQTPPPAPAAPRLGPQADPFHAVQRRAGLPVMRAGHWAKVFLDTQAALPHRHVAAAGAYVFLFQDVLIDRTRHIAPLVPFPPDGALAMPGERVDGGEPLVQVPLPRGAEQFLEVYAEWGSLRSLVAVVTDRRLDEEILLDSRCRRQLRLERLDLLAARLADRRAWPPGSHTIWELQYQVDAATDNAAPRAGAAATPPYRRDSSNEETS
jgi:hypothetical protein